MTKSLLATTLLALCLAIQIGCGSPAQDIPPTPIATAPILATAPTSAPTAAPLPPTSAPTAAPQAPTPIPPTATFASVAPEWLPTALPDYTPTPIAIPPTATPTPAATSTPVPIPTATPAPAAASTPVPTPVAPTSTTAPTVPTTAPTAAAASACAPPDTYTPAPSAALTPLPTNAPAAQPVSYVAHSRRPTPSPLTIEEFIGFADVVARVCITGVSEGVSVEDSPDAWVWDHFQPGNLARNPNRYVAVAEFRFEVLEWLKGGDGSNAAVGLAIFSAEPTEEGTRARGKHNFERRDKRWDNREAIVFMANSHRTVPSSQEDGRYFLGFEENYALDAYRGWLPLAHYSQAPGASCEPEFLMKDPWTLVAPGDVATQTEVETLTLSNLKGLIALPAYELQKRALSHRGWWAKYRSSVPSETSLSDFWAVSYLEEGVRLNWSVSDANPDVIGHRILRRARYEPEFIELADVPVDATVDSEPSYDDTRDIQPETVYIYIMRAYGEDGDIADARISITTIPALDQIDGEDTSPASSADDLKRGLSQKGWTETDSYTPPETNIENLTANTRLGEGIRLHWSISGANPEVIGHRIMRRAWYENESIELADMPVAADGYYEDTQDLLPQTVYIYYFEEYGADGYIPDASISITTVPYLDLDSLDAPPVRAPVAPVPTAAPAAQCEPPAADAPGLPFPDAPPALEERLLNADVVAKVRLLSVSPSSYEIGQAEYENDDALNNIAVISYPRWDDVRIDATEIEFEVLEYLKGGDGSDKIWGLVGVDEENLAKSQVRKIREFYADNLDNIGDNREAIVILRSLNSERVPRDRYLMGSFKSDPLSYSLSSFGGWYPAAPADAANPAEQRFLIEDPENDADGMQVIPTITLSEFKLLVALPGAQLDDVTPIPTPAVIIRAIPFAAEIADTPDLRTKGLGYRDHLTPNSGMLFIFPSGQASSFWMRGMRFPLDFVWIGADCRVADITERVPHPEPGAPDATLPLINPAAPAAYVFEINAGEIERFGIEIGDPARFRNIRPDAANGPDAAYPCDCRETEDCDE